MIKEILLPDLGEGIEGADVSEVVVSVGDSISKDETLLVLESDKASMEIPAEEPGVIKEILVSPGDNVVACALLMKMVISEKNDSKKTEYFSSSNSIALKGYEDPDVLRKFVESYIDYNKVFKSAFANKLNDFYAALGWGQIPENNNLGKFFAFG